MLRAIWDTGKPSRAARKLRISPNTVRTYTQNARSRLGADTTLEAIRKSGVYAD